MVLPHETCKYSGTKLEMGVLFDSRVKKGCYIIFVRECGAFQTFRLDSGLLPSAEASFYSKVALVFMKHLTTLAQKLEIW